MPEEQHTTTASLEQVKYQISELGKFSRPVFSLTNVAKCVDVDIADSPSDCVCNICDRGFKKDKADPKRFHPK